MKLGTALGASAANGYSRVRMAGLCYDTQLDTLDKIPYALL